MSEVLILCKITVNSNVIAANLPPDEKLSQIKIENSIVQLDESQPSYESNEPCLDRLVMVFLWLQPTVECDNKD